MKAPILIAFLLSVIFISSQASEPIDRKMLVQRNNPHVTAIDTLASLTVGNGEFAFTADITGLQTFTELYKNGVPLGTQSQWGWHSFPNPENYQHSETLTDYDFGRGRLEPYSVESREPGRHKDAANYYRANPHRLHLGAIGFDGISVTDITDIDQTLNLWDGRIESYFSLRGERVEVTTAVSPNEDLVAAIVKSQRPMPICLRFPYPTGIHTDDACNWEVDSLHFTQIIEQGPNHALLLHTLDNDSYCISVSWDGEASLEQKGPNYFTLNPSSSYYSFAVEFSPTMPHTLHLEASQYIEDASKAWNDYWTTGGAVDFGGCTDPRAKELERRVVLSQYLLATQCAGSTPPQETGLTYNSWFGKFHLEMIWWHQAQFALWGHPEKLARTLGWYEKAAPNARKIAQRQGFKGLRWMKMTDPDAGEAPSKVGSFLIWQQPHLIYLAEMLYRAGDTTVIDRYFPLVEATAEFMTDFADLDSLGRFTLHGIIPAQETLKASETINPPFELSYWHYGLSTAQKWRERKGLPRDAKTDTVLMHLSHLAAIDTLYLAAESAPDTYNDIRFTSDHMAVLGALGVLPDNDLIDDDIMRSTFNWIYQNWNWDKTWGWDYPTTAMCAVRLGKAVQAINALLMDQRTNTYLPNGHNYQDSRLRCYLPGNGGLLTAVALMCAGWDGCTQDTPGFPKDGTWNVKWEGLLPLP